MGERVGLRVRAGLLVLVLCALAYPMLPDGSAQDVWYDGVGAVSVLLGWLGVRRHRPARERAWLLVLAGFLGWVLGDVLSSFEQSVWHLSAYPVPSDGVYLISYVLLGGGLLAMVRGRRSRRDLSIVLDAAIIGTGAAVVAGVFVLAPIASDSTLSTMGKLVSSAYPLADVMMISIVVRLWSTPGARSTAFLLLTSALGVTLLGDVIWNLGVVSSGSGISSESNDTLWLVGYALLAGACWAPSMRGVAEPSPTQADRLSVRTRLVALTGGLLLPAVALLVDGLDGGSVHWQVVGVGSIVLSILVLARMAGLLGVVQVQAVQLAALARSDGLTGAPNRRTWDHELSHACQVSRETGSTLSVALLDLDHFKDYNDTHGHQAGDMLLREAVAQWSDLLLPGEMLARYGGEEFAVLMPGLTPTAAMQRLDVLRTVTPHGQTFSAGVAPWVVDTSPADALAAADEALYQAKRTGRNQIQVAGRGPVAPSLPTPRIVLQPIVDLHSGATVAVEALSRFAGESPATVFERAHRDGRGPELEAVAVAAALRVRPAGLLLTLNVSLASLIDPHLVAVLPEDLSGIAFEITEHSDMGSDRRLDAALSDLRRRGARLAVDDWGKGYSNLDRLLRLRPEIVKLDISLVHGLESDYHRATIRSVTAWADEVGVSVCAEGVETEQQRHVLVTLGVHTAQGYLFGAPASPETSVTSTWQALG